MKRIIPFILICLLWQGTVVRAQTITGRVLDATSPVPYATVILKKDTTTLQVALSDSLGGFKFSDATGWPLGLYISRVGYMDIDTVLGKTPQQPLQLLLKSDIKLLKGVTVKAKKPLIERKIDRLVFNVENSIASQGMDGAEALANTPMLKVNEQNGISIVGKNNAMVMINDRMLNLSGSELMNYLKSIRSDNIAKVEVITTPPAKYDAQGNSGLINIVLKKNPNIGWSGNASTTLSQRAKSGFANNIVLNYQSEKLKVSADARQSDIPMHSTGFSNLVGIQSVFENGNSRNRSNVIGGTFNLDYALNKKSSLGVNADYSETRKNSKLIADQRYQTNNITDSLLNTLSDKTDKTKTLVSSAYYDILLDTNGKKLSIIGNYLLTTPKNEVDFNTLNQTTGNRAYIHTDNRLNYYVYSVQADLTFPYKWASIETGAKFTGFFNGSKLQYYDLINGNYQINPQISNDFEYNEKNIAAYISFNKTFNKQWSSKAGLRYEYSLIDGYSPILNQRNKSNYGRVFPTFYLSYKKNEANTFSLSYSRRISRPNFSALNPFRSYSNPYRYYVGNPKLQPSYNDNIELSYTFRNKLSVSLYANHWQDGNAYIATFEDGYLVNRQENYIDQKSAGISIFYSDNFFKIWDFMTSLNTSYMKSKTWIAETVALNGFNTSLNVNNTFYLNQQKTLSVIANFIRFFGNKSGNIQNYPNSNLNSGVRYSLLNKTLQISATVNDIFKKEYWKGKSIYTGYYTENRSYADVRRISLTVAYSFGNNKVKGATRNVRFDEKLRVN